jgi:hypothetical protein
MRLWRSKCNTCGEFSYIFPDQIEIIKKNDNLKLHKFVPKAGHLAKGDKWFCIKCDASKKWGGDCYIYEEVTGDKAKNLLAIRKRETNLKSEGFILPQLY